MREILFRGKRYDNHEWAFGSLFADYADCSLKEQGRCLCPHDGSVTYLMVWDDEYHEYGFVEVDHSTVGQFTGMKDKNGQKIFEGDIIDCWSEGIRAQGTVQQNRGGLWIIYPAWQSRIMWGLCPNEDMTTDVEIIGNIHDNPELLEGETP